jgi:hypothetical protein
MDYGTLVSVKIIRHENIIDIKTTTHHFWIRAKSSNKVAYKIDASSVYGYKLCEIKQIDHSVDKKEILLTCEYITIPITILSSKKISIGITDDMPLANTYVTINEYFQVKKRKSVIFYILNFLT